jgi:hypothetical protein
MITANGGITSATAETTIAAATEYRSSTAQERTNNPMQTVMSTRYRRLSRRDGCGPGSCGPDGCGAADPSRSPPLSVASSSPLPEAPPRLAVPYCWLIETPTSMPTPWDRADTLERSRENVLEAARPLPPDEDMVIKELSDEEDRLFLAVIIDL